MVVVVKENREKDITTIMITIPKSIRDRRQGIAIDYLRHSVWWNRCYTVLSFKVLFETD